MRKACPHPSREQNLDRVRFSYYISEIPDDLMHSFFCKYMKELS